MDIASVVTGLYGAFTLAGGIIGYVKAKSTASLLAGSASGILLLLCAYQAGQGSRVAVLSSLGIALALGARFFGTWRRNRRLMPDLLMVLFSAAVMLADGFALLGR